MSDRDQRLGAGAYVVAGLSFIPLLGVPFGIAAVVWGLVTRRAGGRLLALLGAGGIAFTIVVYGSLFYFGFYHRGGMFDDMRRQLTQSQLDALVPAIEFYKIGNGTYPPSLKELQESLPKNSFTTVFDTSNITAGGGMQYFYYERVGSDHYYLRSVGPDGLPFTPDDLTPQVNPSAASKIGLLYQKR
jgi:hypothetical protein